MNRITRRIVILTAVSMLGAIHADTAKLIRYFPFDQGLAESIDGNEPTKTLGSPKLVSGISGQAIQLDGSSALVYDDYFDLNLERFSLTAWVYIEDKNQTGYIAGREHGGYWLFFNHGEIKSGFNSDKPHECYSGLYLQPKEWYFLALTYDGQTIRSYINNHLDSIKKIESTPRQMETPFMIGAERVESPNHNFNGIIDEVRLYDGILTKEEISRLFKQE